MCVCLFTYLVNCATTYEISYSAVYCVACFLCRVNICLLIRIYPPPSPLCSMFWEADLHSWTPLAGISASHFRVFYLSFFLFLPIRDEKMKDLRAKGRKWGWIFIPPASSLWACHAWLRPSAEGHHSAGLFLPHNYSLWVCNNFLGPVDLEWK